MTRDGPVPLAESHGRAPVRGSPRRLRASTSAPSRRSSAPRRPRPGPPPRTAAPLSCGESGPRGPRPAARPPGFVFPRLDGHQHPRRRRPRSGKRRPRGRAKWQRLSFLTCFQSTGAGSGSRSWPSPLDEREPGQVRPHRDRATSLSSRVEEVGIRPAQTLPVRPRRRSECKVVHVAAGQQLTKRSPDRELSPRAVPRVAFGKISRLWA